jgi:hypothetical protein
MKIRLIEINAIPHAEQRYPTWADWEHHGDKLTITVSEVADWRHIRLAAIHELLEETVCRHMGILQVDVDAFDVDYENRRMAGEPRAVCGCEITNDPGSDIHAPYRLAHKYAESVEYGLAKLLDVDPVAYDNAFIALDGGVARNRKKCGRTADSKAGVLTRFEATGHEGPCCFQGVATAD